MPKVMLVEDDNNLREIYEARLQAEGYTIVAAKDGEEALAVAKAEKPDLIISDVMMPRISGFEMLDILRNTDGLKEVKVIMLTALGQSDDQQRADRLGADRYLVKSQVTLEDIVKVAHELLQDAPEPEAPVDPVAPAIPPAPTTAAPTAAPDPAPAIAIAPAPDPVAPATDPAAITTSATPDPVVPVADPPTDTAQQSGQASANAQSTSEEEAGVEAKIEDFVAGASSEASTVEDGLPTMEVPVPEPAPITEPSTPEPPVTEAPPAEPVIPEPTSEEPVASPAEKAAADDKLLTDAVDNLSAGVKEAPEPPVTEAPPAEPAPVPEPADDADPAPQNDNVKIAHKKVIEPIASDSGKPDISTLVALEEAKEAAVQGPPPPTAVIATDEAGQQATAIDAAAAQAQATDYAAAKAEEATKTPGEAGTASDANNIAL